MAVPFLFILAYLSHFKGKFKINDYSIKLNPKQNDINLLLLVDETSSEFPVKCPLHLLLVVHLNWIMTLLILSSTIQGTLFNEFYALWINNSVFSEEMKLILNFCRTWVPSINDYYWTRCCLWWISRII